jgi:acyl-CoA synthetase (AMP-forming)/AMP-acid ligase II
MNIGRADRVAVVVPNGPEMAAAFLAVASAAVCAPLNPGYGEEEFRFYLGDIEAKALMLPIEYNGVARTVANELGILCLDIHWNGDWPAGRFELTDQRSAGHGVDFTAQPDDLALILHTSGTTSRPKIVPITHRSLCASAFNVSRSLELSAQDRCLNVMPLFHIHGLVAALLASLASGGSVACTPGYRDGQFLPWLNALRPTWITAVPTVHQESS